MEKQESDLAFITVPDAISNPMHLFSEWRKEANANKNNSSLTSVMCLATVSKEGDVSNRNVLVVKIDDDGFIFLTDGRSNKSKDIEYNPKVAATFLWHYVKEGVRVMRQVRIQGTLREIDNDMCETIYNKMPLFAKIRSNLCHQDQEVDWDELKKAHDVLLDEVIRNEKRLPKPNHEVGYKLIPRSMEFYYAYDECIADRVKFFLVNDEWKYCHLAA